MGKTALALNLGRNIAYENEANVLIFSLEMGTEQLLQRVIAAEANLSISKVKTGRIIDSEMDQVLVAIDNLNKMDFNIDDTGGITIGELKSKARILSKEKKLDVIIIDYLQLINVARSSRADNRQQEVSEISRELKALAKELQLPIIALSQLSRGVEARTDRRPMMSDLRESGAIEQDADLVMALYRAEYYENNEFQDKTTEGDTELIILKNRNGELATINLKFLKEYSKFLSKVNQ